MIKQISASTARNKITYTQKIIQSTILH